MGIWVIGNPQGTLIKQWLEPFGSGDIEYYFAFVGSGEVYYFFDSGFDLVCILEGYFRGGEVFMEEAVIFAGGYVVVEAFIEGVYYF